MIPLATTTVSISDTARPEPYEAATATVRASGVPAHISAPSGQERSGSDGLERIDAVLLVDATVARNDTVTDEATAAVYRVAWVTVRTGLGLDHARAGLVATAGEVAA